MVPAAIKSIILICCHEGCGFSICVRRGTLPVRCCGPKAGTKIPGGCGKLGNWRVALPGEFTESDRELLREGVIKAE